MSARSAHAHPLGNFTTNGYARVEVSSGVIRVHYVLDLAEIRTVQEKSDVGQTPTERAEYQIRRSRAIADGLDLVVDGTRLGLGVTATDLSFPPGQGGLDTLRLAITLETAIVGPGPFAATLRDGNELDRPGWRELVVVARGDARILESTAPAFDATDELRFYPTDADASRPISARVQASFRYEPGTTTAGPAPLTRSYNRPIPRSGLTGLVTRTTGSPLALVGLLAVAAGFGAVHALAPGHGKAIMAAYLVTTRGRIRDAAAVGGAVSLMHTASTIALAIVVSMVARTIQPEELFPVLTIVSGAAVGATGVFLFVRRTRRDRAHTAEHGEKPDHDHEHGGHDQHQHHHHPELPAGVSPLSWQGLGALATSGGLYPSPSAVVVLVGAFSLGRAALGVGLVFAFSVGLAATLALVGALVVLGRGIAQKRASLGVRRALPIVSAAAVIVLGVVLAVRGIVDLQ